MKSFSNRFCKVIGGIWGGEVQHQQQAGWGKQTVASNKAKANTVSSDHLGMGFGLFIFRCVFLKFINRLATYTEMHIIIMYQCVVHMYKWIFALPTNISAKINCLLWLMCANVWGLCMCCRVYARVFVMRTINIQTNTTYTQTTLCRWI